MVVTDLHRLDDLGTQAGRYRAARLATTTERNGDQATVTVGAVEAGQEWRGLAALVAVNDLGDTGFAGSIVFVGLPLPRRLAPDEAHAQIERLGAGQHAGSYLCPSPSTSTADAPRWFGLGRLMRGRTDW